MDTPRYTPTATVIDMTLRDRDDDGLRLIVARMRAAGESWRSVAATLTALTDVPVSHEAVRVWALDWPDVNGAAR